MKTKLSKIAIGMGLVLGMGAQAQAEGLYFNSGLLGGGADSFKEIAAFDWLPGNFLAKDSAITSIGKTFTGYYQSELSRITYTDGSFDNLAIGPNGPLEITAGLQISEKVLGATDGNGDGLNETTTFQHTGGTFTIYFDPLSGGTVNADGIVGTSGLGYQDGTPIAAGSVMANVGNDVGANYSITSVATTPILDQNGSNNWPGKTTYSGVGTSNISLDVSLASLSSTWFRGAGNSIITDPSIVTSFVLTNNNNPFGTINPESSVVGQTPTHLGGRAGDNFNGVTVAEAAGCAVDPTGAACKDDFQFLADASQNFQVTRVPEPDGLSLLGIGVVGMALASRRRKNA
jgi:hypothetical protein